MSKRNIVKKDITNIDNYDLHVRSKNDNTYDVIAYFMDKKYILNINEKIINGMPKIIVAYPILLKQILEKHIYSIERNSFFFHLKYNNDNTIMLSFILDLNEIKESISLLLMLCDDDILDIEKRISSLDVKKMDLPKRYILCCTKYANTDDQFFANFKWSIADQHEKEKYANLVHKYIVYNDMFFRIEPLILEVYNNKCHLYGMLSYTPPNNNDTFEIILPIPDDCVKLKKYNRIVQIKSKYQIMTNTKNFIFVVDKTRLNLMQWYTKLSAFIPQTDLSIFKGMIKRDNYILPIDEHFIYDIDMVNNIICSNNQTPNGFLTMC